MKVYLSSKIHNCFVTGQSVNYIGSIGIDSALMEKANLKEYEKVLVCNVDTGEQFWTYVDPKPKGSGIITLQGSIGRKGEKGDKLNILSFEQVKKANPKKILVDKTNKFVKYL